MKKNILIIIVSFISILSHAQYDALKESLDDISSAPSFLIIKVKTPSYEGEAAILSVDFYDYLTKEDTFKLGEYQDKYTKEEYKKYFEKYERHIGYLMDSVYYDIKQGKYFFISDEDFKFYNFDKVIINDTVLNNAKKGMETFINIYCLKNGRVFAPRTAEETFTIIKILFEAGIQIGIECEYSHLRIKDPRFKIYMKETEEWEFIIPPEYRDRKE